MNILRKYKISKILNKPLDGVEAEIISFMKSITDDLIPFKHNDFHDSIFYMNSKGNWIFEQNNKYVVFRVRYNLVWEVLETKYLMKDDDIQVFIKYMVEEAFKSKISTPIEIFTSRMLKVEEAFKSKISTPRKLAFNAKCLVEEAFKSKISTPNYIVQKIFSKVEEAFKEIIK